MIQNMLHYYIQETHNPKPLKPTIMKLTYIRKLTFNINDTTIHFALAIPINKKFKKFKALNDERCDISIIINNNK
jgi:hypothetical protein